MDNRKRPNCCTKFWLLLWKNIRVLCGSICLMISMVAVFIVLPCLFMLCRLHKKLKNPVPYKPGVSISEKLSMNYIDEIFYSPENAVLQVLLQTGNIYGRGCRNAKELFAELRQPNETSLSGGGMLLGTKETQLKIGIEFPDSLSDITELPDALSFSIRLPGTMKTMGTHELVRLSSDVYNTFFLSIQNSLSRAYIENKAIELNMVLENMSLIQPNFKEFPDRQHLTDPKLDLIFSTIDICFLVLTILMAIVMVKSIVEEKHLQIKETLNLVGIGNCLQWFTWYVHFFVLLLIASAIYTVCWTIALPSNDYAFIFFTHWSTFLVILLVYSHCLICLCFMISSFMSTTRRAALNTIIVLVLLYFPSHLELKGLVFDVFLSINTISAMGLLTRGFKNKELFGVGVQWHNIMKITYPADTLSIGFILVLMLVGSLIWLFICLYVEQLRPGSYGMAKPWHFPCTSCCRRGHSLFPYMKIFQSCFAVSQPPPDVERPDPPGLQLRGPDPKGKSPGVQIKDLSKTFGKKQAVRGVTFDIFKDEITVLLGHNGAGKTTLISMLACFTKPTSGTALVNGHDICKNPRKAQQCIGLCPQHNVLFRNLGVASHIRLFSQLRGLRGKELKEEVAKYVAKLNFQTKKRTSAHKLSGGGQRRLSIACSLCGGVKVVICDEPSTGLDPASRRDLWKLIIESKQDCTILLTTHQMDDGEVLGDRIVIISDGKLRCMGSLAYLKQQVDASSLLTCETDPRCDVNRLTAFMAGYVIGIRPFRIIGRDVCYKLPQSKAGIFPALFRDLERQQMQLRVRGFGLSGESLEEIFMNYGAEDYDARRAGGAERKSTDLDDDDEDDEISEDDSSDDDNYKKNKCSCCAHWRAMSLKKILALNDYKIYFIILLLLPIIIYLARVISGTQTEKMPKLRMNSKAYTGLGLSILVSEPKDLSEESSEGVREVNSAIDKFVGSAIELKRISEPVDEYVRKAYSTPEGQREMLFVLCAVSLEDPIIAWVGAKELIHAAPMTINLAYNIVAQTLFGDKVSIEVVNNPYEDHTNLALTSIAEVLTIIVYLSILLTLLAIPIINERISHMKMQQEVSGLGMFTYWLSHLVYDWLVYSVFALILLLPLYQYGIWHHILFVLLLIGLSGLCLVYLLTCLCRASGLTIFLMLLLSIVIIIIVFLLSIVSFVPTIGTVFQIYVLGFFHPLTAGYYALMKSVSYSSTCADSADIRNYLKYTCINVLSYVSPSCVCQHPIDYPESPFLIVMALIFWTLLMFYEYCGCLWYLLKGCCTAKRSAAIQDPKVYKESERIKNMEEDRRARRALVVQSVAKKYCCGPLAVNSISFAIRPRACLGLLGHNGAGKTTTFKMIVGEESIDRGEIWIRGYSLKTDRRRAIRELGYCPQFDSFFEYFTGRQMMRFFLQLRGADPKDIEDRINQSAEKFAFTKHLDNKIKYYSGGTKRKINAAVGCMGKSLICLDEPSSGVDPASRRHVWNILGTLGSKGKAILLTSHSMDEINALCSKVIMLVDGNIHSMGSNQHVKNKSSKGLELRLVVKAKPEDMTRVLSGIEDDLLAAYPKAVLQEKYEFSGRLTFLIPKENASWADIFALVDRKRESWQLEDYTLQQPSLENVFVEIEEAKKKKAKSSN